MEKINIGIIGIGYWGQNLFRVFSQLPRINKLYVYDKDPQRLEKIDNNSNKFIKVFSLEDLLSNKVDAVVIATPAKTHFELTKNFLLEKINVLVEKPFCFQPNEARELIEIAKKNNLKLMVDYTFIYNDAVRKVKEIVENNELGEILYISTERLNLGKIRDDVNVWWNLAPHDVSIIYYLLNELPEDYSAKGMSFIQENIEDVVFCTLTFPNKILAAINVSWLHPLKIRRITIVGTKKMLIYDDVSTTAKVTIFDKGFDKVLFPKELTPWKDFGHFQILQRTGDIIIPYINFREPLQVMANHFVDCIINGSEPLTNGEKSLPITEILFNVHKILRDGKN